MRDVLGIAVAGVVGFAVVVAVGGVLGWVLFTALHII